MVPSLYSAWSRYSLPAAGASARERAALVDPLQVGHRPVLGQHPHGDRRRPQGVHPPVVEPEDAVGVAVLTGYQPGDLVGRRGRPWRRHSLAHLYHTFRGPARCRPPSRDDPQYPVGVEELGPAPSPRTASDAGLGRSGRLLLSADFDAMEDEKGAASHES